MTYPNGQITPKKIVMDSSTLITISDNCMMRVMKWLSEKENITFVIPESVYAESVQTPVNIKKFELSAIRIRDAVEDGYVTVEKSTPRIKNRLQRLQYLADNLCTFNGEKLRLLHLGEMETLALLKETGASALAIDERTTRMLIEEPRSMMDFLRRRHSGKINLNGAAVDEFSREYGSVKIVRSTELIALAFEDGSFGMEMHPTRQALEAALFAAKFAGCAVSVEEIKNYMGRIR